MKKLNKSQAIAVFVGLAFITYIVFGDQIMSIFNLSMDNTSNSADSTSGTGVDIQDVTVGTGAEAHSGDVLSVHYVGRLTNGQVFDSSYDRNAPIEFTLGTGQVIRGWEEGFAGMRVGGKRTLVISPEYGYGASGAGPIPPNSTLIFDVELVNVTKPQ